MKIISGKTTKIFLKELSFNDSVTASAAAIEPVADKMLNTMKSLAPRATGLLQDSLTRTEIKANGTRVSCAIGLPTKALRRKVFYWHFVEFGHLGKIPSGRKPNLTMVNIGRIAPKSFLRATWHVDKNAFFESRKTLLGFILARMR